MLIIHACVLTSFIIMISRLLLYFAVTIELFLTSKNNNTEQYCCTCNYGTSDNFLNINYTNFLSHTQKYLTYKNPSC
jgi:hypothetical protein